MLALEIIIGERCPAVAAEAARRLVGAVEPCRRAARPVDRIARHADQRNEEIARRLLAHAAMADMRRVEHRRHMIAHRAARSEEHTSELQSLMRISYAVFCLQKQKKTT